MAGGQKKKNKGLAWLLTCILAVSAVFPQMVYADVMQEPETEAALAYASAAPEFYLIGDASGTPDLQTGLRSAFAAASAL